MAKLSILKSEKRNSSVRKARRRALGKQLTAFSWLRGIHQASLKSLNWCATPGGGDS